jgi:hypothetical protein
MNFCEIDRTLHPVVVITFKSSEPTTEMFMQYLDDMLAIYQEEQDVSFVFDSSAIKYLSAEFRVMQGNWLKEHKTLIARRQKCLVFVIPSMMQRFLLDAIMIVAPMPAPYAIVKTVPEGISLACEKLGIPPASASRYERRA